MSYTQNITYQADCNYINPMLSNAREMLNPCINKPGHKPDYHVEIEGDLCTGKPGPQSEYHTFENNLSNNPSLNIINQNKQRQSDLVQRQANLINYLNNDNKQFQKSYEEYNKDLDKKPNPKIYESKPCFPKYVLPKVEEEVHNDNGDVIEGFVPGDFVSDNGPGEQHVVGCPDEYEFCSKSGMCKKKVVHGRTRVDDSDYTDICHPNNYDGIDNMGHIMCSTELDVDGARLQLSTNITNQSSMNEIIRNYIR